MHQNMNNECVNGGNGSGDGGGGGGQQLPPGFRFYPTDEELVVHFLHRKAALLPFHPDVIPDLDLYPHNPWELLGKALAEGNKMYFFSRKTRNRMTGNGYWKPLGVDEPIFTRAPASHKVGMKKHYAFYTREAPSSGVGVKTNWIMHEYRLSDSAGSCTTTTSSSSRRSSKRRGSPKIASTMITENVPKIDRRKWVLCRVYQRNCSDDDDNNDDGTVLSCLDEVFLSLDDLDEISLPN